MNDKFFAKKIFLFLFFALFSALFFSLTFNLVLDFFFNIKIDDLNVKFFSREEIINKKTINIFKLQALFNTLGMFLIPSLFYFFFFKKWHYLSFKRFNFRYRDIFLLITVCLLSFPVVERLHQINILLNPPSFLSETINQLSERAEQIMDLFLSTTDFGGLFFNIFLLAFMPAVAEEFFFRGVFQTLLIKKTKKIVFSVLFTAFIFAFFHLQFFKIIPIFYAGVILGFLYLWTSSIWVPIFFHFIFNSFQVVIYFFSENKVDFIIEENNNLYLVICLVGVFCLLYLFKKTIKNQSSFFVE